MTGLRERKKLQTRQAIQRAAYRLFADHGYDATPMDRIAAAAEVSLSTVFRYFPTKEDIVLTDEYDALIADTLRARPLNEPPITSLRHVTVGLLGQFAGPERNDMLTRLALIRQSPALRSRLSEALARTGVMLTEVLADRSGRSPDDFEVRIVVAAVLGALQEAVFHCFDHQHIEDMEETINHALELLSHGLPL
jgi:AcrR family transcriptional regulator